MSAAIPTRRLFPSSSWISMARATFDGVGNSSLSAMVIMLFNLTECVPSNNALTEPSSLMMAPRLATLSVSPKRRRASFSERGIHEAQGLFLLELLFKLIWNRLSRSVVLVYRLEFRLIVLSPLSLRPEDSNHPRKGAIDTQPAPSRVVVLCTSEDLPVLISHCPASLRERFQVEGLPRLQMRSRRRVLEQSEPRCTS